jgi:hypothetical protein
MAFALGTAALAQSNECHVLDEGSYQQPSQSGHCDETIYYVPDQSYLSHTPELIINVNIHFILRSDGSGNFKAPGNELPGEVDGVAAANQLLQAANSRLGQGEGLEPYSLNPAAQHVPESRLRLNLYHEPGNPLDPFGGVHFIYDDAAYTGIQFPGLPLFSWKSSFSVYGSQVIDVFMGELELAGGGYVNLAGQAPLRSFNGVAGILGMYNDHITPGQHGRDIVKYRISLLHEIFHVLGLHHSYYCHNPCRGVDLHPTLECNHPTMDCATTPLNPAGCNLWESPSNNLMTSNPNITSLTPCQLGIVHHFLRTERPGYMAFDFCEISEPDIVIADGDDISWDSQRYLRGNVLVEAGGKLTIRCELGFPEGAGIRVEPGGRLIVDGGRLTSNCEGTWEGILAQGDPGWHQYFFGQQAVVDLINGAHIEHARIALDAPQGGLARVDGAHFVNNQASIAVYDYVFVFLNGTEVNNRGYVRNSTFSLDGGYRFDSFYAHAYARGVRGLPITGCEFGDGRDFSALPPSLWQDNLGAGISLHDAHANIFGCLFEGMPFGIDAQGLSQARSFSVRDSRFHDCYMGISARAVDHFRVFNGNEFLIGGYAKPEPAIAASPGAHCGLFIDRCTGFRVTGNAFEKSAQAGSATAIGTCSRDTNASAPGVEGGHDDFNEIRGNAFSGVDIANLANGVNAGITNPERGLIYTCNTQAANASDIRVVLGTVAARQIDPAQVAAANTFSACPGGFAHIDNLLGNNIDYHYWDGDALEDPHCSPPFKVERIVTPRNECIALNPPSDGAIKKQLFDSLSARYLEAHQGYWALLDGGDKTAVLALIESATPHNREAIKAQLLGYAPYLSGASLHALLDNGTFTKAQQAQALAACPEELRREALWAAAEGHGFNAQQMEALEAAREAKSARDSAELELASRLGQLHRLGGLLLQEEAEQDSAALADSEHWLRGLHSLSAAGRRVGIRLQLGDTLAARAALDSIELQLGPALLAEEEPAQWLELMRLAIDIQAAGRSWRQLTAAEEAKLEHIADYSQTAAGTQAQNILMGLGWSRAYHRGPLLDGGAPELRLPAAPPQAAATARRQVVAFPNPASGLVSFRYGLARETAPWTSEDDTEGAELRVFSLAGQELARIPLARRSGLASWDGSGYPTGIYFYRLYIAGRAGESGRFAIAR